MRRVIILLIVAIIVAVGMYLFLGREGQDPSSQDSSNSGSSVRSETATESSDNIRLVALGDMIPHDTLNLRAMSGDSYDYTQFFANTSKYINGADGAFCNQESPSAGQEFGISGYPTFNAPEKFSQDLNSVGCNIINLANNHIADKGQAAIDKTLQTWQGINPLAYSGASSDGAAQLRPSYFEVKGVKFGFIAFTDLSNNSTIPSTSLNMFSPELVSKLAREAAANSDFVIASAHWGTEDSSQVNAGQQQWAQSLADGGVDLIIGTGPHVLQTVDQIQASDGREVTVWYSLGNFLSTQLTIDQLVGGIAAIEIDTSNEQPKVVDLSFMPTYMHYEWTAEQAATEDLLARDNLMVYPLAEAADPLSLSVFDVTVDQQISRVKDLLNQNIEVEISNPANFLN